MTSAELRAKWVEALRSGKYNQTRSCLKNLDGHCCLGVLCDVVNPKGWLKGAGHEQGIGSMQNLMPDDGVMRSVGVDRKGLRRLAEANDIGETFAQIADRIERLP